MPRDERTLEEVVTDPAVPPALASGELEILGLMPRASNYTFLVAATAADGDQVLGVYKPQRGETPLWDFPEGTLCRREVAAYVVARTLGWPNVPPTVLRDGPEGLGSVQLFVEFDPGEHYFTLQERHPDAFREVALFDLVANNTDRKSGHCLLDRNGRIWVIDHGVCFSEEPKLRTVIWEYIGEPIPDRLLADLGRFRVDLADGPVRETLDALLLPQELEAMSRRVAALLADPVFSEPESNDLSPGPYPWPPI